MNTALEHFLQASNLSTYTSDPDLPSLTAAFKTLLPTLNAFASNSPLPAGTLTLQSLALARHQLLGIKIHCETEDRHNRLAYLTPAIRSWFKHKLPIWRILALFKDGDHLDKLERKTGLLLHDFDSFVFCTPSSPQYSCVDLKWILEESTVHLNSAFPLLKYDSSVRKLSPSHLALLLNSVLQNVLIEDPEKATHARRYLSLPGLLLTAPDASGKRAPLDFGKAENVEVLDALMAFLGRCNSRHSLSEEKAKLMHLTLRRIFWDIGAVEENRFVLSALLQKNPVIWQSFFKHAVSSYESAEGIRIFPNSLLLNGDFVFQMFQANGLVNQACFPASISSASLTISQDGSASKAFHYFSSLHGDLVLIDGENAFSKAIFCLLAHENPLKIIDLIPSRISGIRGGQNLISLLFRAYKETNLKNNLPVQLRMLLEGVEEASGGSLTSLIDPSAPLRMATTILKLLQTKPEYADELKKSLPGPLHLWFDVAMKAIKKIRPEFASSYWSIGVVCSAIVLFFVGLFGLVWVLQKWKVFSVSQFKPEVQAVLEEDACEQEYHVWLSEAEERELRELGADSLCFHE